MSKIIIYNNNHQQFEMFLFLIFSLMYFNKQTLNMIKSDLIKRKFNQYTNWNLLMILVNYILNNCFNIHNILISKFIAHNSLQVMLLFHGFLLYDKRILFLTIDTTPFLLKYTFNDTFSNQSLIKFEYFLCNIIIHIIPLYYQTNILINYNSYDNTTHIYMYTILLKFMWILNVFGNFDITSIYVSSFNLCNVKFINAIILSDYIIDRVLTKISY